MNIKHCVISLAATAVALFGGALSDAARNTTDTLSYKVSMKTGAGNMGTRTMTMKGNQFFWDCESPGLHIKLVKNNDGTFMIGARNRYIAKYPPGTNRESPYTLLPGPHGDVNAFLQAQSAKKLGQETIELGKVKPSDKTVAAKCDVYSYTEKSTGSKCKLWVNPKTGLPAKLLLIAPKKEENITVVYNYYKLGAAVDESVFKLPEGIPIRDMPKEAFEAPKGAGNGSKPKS